MSHNGNQQRVLCAISCGASRIVAIREVTNLHPIQIHNAIRRLRQKGAVTVIGWGRYGPTARGCLLAEAWRKAA
jgi:hypothetical protein